MECTVKIIINPNLPEGVTAQYNATGNFVLLKIYAWHARNVPVVLEAANKRIIVSGIKKVRFNWKGCPSILVNDPEVKKLALAILLREETEGDLAPYVALTYKHIHTHVAVPDFRRIDDEQYQPRIINYIKHLCGRRRLSDDECLRIAYAILDMEEPVVDFHI